MFYVNKWRLEFPRFAIVGIRWWRVTGSAQKPPEDPLRWQGRWALFTPKFSNIHKTVSGTGPVSFVSETYKGHMCAEHKNLYICMNSCTEFPVNRLLYSESIFRIFIL
jgi:hypothetical protein